MLPRRWHALRQTPFIKRHTFLFNVRTLLTLFLFSVSFSLLSLYGFWVQWGGEERAKPKSAPDPFCTSFGGKKIKIHVVVPGNTIVADYEEPDFQHKLSLFIIQCSPLAVQRKSRTKHAIHAE